MIGVTIKTNGRRRPLLEWHELTNAERSEFDYLQGNDIAALAAKFFRFKDEVYHLGDMVSVPAEWHRQGWRYYHNHTAWSGIVVKYARNEWLDIDTDAVVVGTYIS